METANRPARRRSTRRFTNDTDEIVSAIETAPPAAETVDDNFERRPMRPSMREDNPRDAAAKRAAEIRGHLPGVEENTDEFFIPAGMIPDGWTYEWKRHTVYGAEDPAYQVALARTGWEPVPLRRHPKMMPVNWKGETIERKGVILMQRPKEITDTVEETNRRRARNQVRAKEQQLAAAPPGTMEREFSDPRTKPQIRKSFEAMPVPADE